MRHVFGLLLGMALAPALAYGMGWGYARSGESVHPLTHTITDRTQLYGAFALMASVGLVSGIVIVARWASPLISLVPAVAFLAWTGYFLASPAEALDLVGKFPPTGDLDTGMQVMLATGAFALAGFALLVPMWTPGRWRRKPREQDYA